MRDVKINATTDRRDDVGASKVADTGAQTVNRVEIGRVNHTLRQLQAKALIYMPSDTLA